jgi:hypothetical protein
LIASRRGSPLFVERRSDTVQKIKKEMKANNKFMMKSYQAA